MRIILFGTGNYYQRWKHSFDHSDIVCLIDNDRNKSGQVIDGHSVDIPDNIHRYEYDFIFILARDSVAMREQLIGLGVAEDTILDIEQSGPFRLVSPVVSFFSHRNESGKRILLLTNTLDLTGAPLVLYDAARILIGHGYCIHVISPYDGFLREKYLSIGASVSIVGDILQDGEQISFFLDWADICFINTLVYYPIFSVVRDKKKRIVWWLHEEENYYTDLSIGVSEDALPDLKIYGVGSRAIESFRRHFPKARIEELHYGVADRSVMKRDHKRVIYAFIGVCDHRKGADIFEDSIRMLNEHDRAYCEYWIIGDIGDSERQRFEQIKGVRIFGRLDREELLRYYEYIDVVVCPSRNDPMPVVVTEGMMNRKMCIVSEDVGQASMIRDKENGLICKTGSASDLFEKMLWTYDNRELLNSIGEKARHIYEEHFSMDVFADSILKIAEHLQ